ncbi:MAG: hypothetical protein H8M99_13645 [Gloeobacteraceae cyanobacterium ES-bin-144]|nr:hypothetical protein [Verrucomicrobiales bacterium]
MKDSNSTSAVFPVRVSSQSGMSVEINSNGSLRRMDHGDIMLNLFLGNEADGGPTNIYLRCHGVEKKWIPLFGPNSPARCEICEDGMMTNGEWNGIVFRVKLLLADSARAWFWHVELENNGSDDVSCDLIYTQDLALAHYGAVRLNEYYVSHYIDHTAIEHTQRGVAVASRQNQSMGGRCPWTVIGSLGKGVAYATDAIQIYGLATRAGDAPIALDSGLPAKRLQREHSMVSIQDELILLKPGAKTQRGFFGSFELDKPSPTSASDISFIDQVTALPEASSPQFPSKTSGVASSAGLFAVAPLLDSMDFDETEIREHFAGEPRHVECENGQLFSFFHQENGHVVLKAKELKVLRPHGHLLRSGGALTPDESALTSTAWMSGVFHSMVTQGHVSINRFLSTCHSYLGLFRSHGQRVFVEIDGAWILLGIPSAFEMTPSSCRWIYKHSGGLIEVVSSAPDDRNGLHLTVSILQGPPARFLVSHHVAIHGDDGSMSIPVIREVVENGVFVRAVADSDVGRRFPDGGFLIAPHEGTRYEAIGGDELLYADAVTRNQPFLCFVTSSAHSIGLKMEGRLVPESADQKEGFWNSIGADLKISTPPESSLAPAASRVAEIFPWFIHNALIHYLSPRGLEQYSGGGWGTRDICQGPVELLLALGHFSAVRDILLRVFRQQNADGDWPQWFMFFERERNIRPGDSHGDIVYWPVLALAQYLTATGDAALLEEKLPFFHGEGDAAAETATVWSHVERALELIFKRVIPGTNLAAYGHGDWNDSLQPAKPEMRESLCSSWTVTLNYQTFIALGKAFRHLGNADRASEYEAMAANILQEFQNVLIVNDVVTGLAYFHQAGKIDYLLHPQDRSTGLSYSVLPMIHAIINDMFTPRQAMTHLGLIRKHLLGPDGAHLFDRPMAYHGGLQINFQRAESATYFGREIGNMYTHAHLRYCEALAHFGDADAFFDALCRINPIGLRDLVSSATLRQSNCYYSSSDAAFSDRYEAHEQYERVRSGDVKLEGGWRVYSSGAGIGVRLIMQCFLGLRLGESLITLDPVIPAALDGLRVRLRIAGKMVQVLYRIGVKGSGVLSASLNGADLDFIRENNPYRAGAMIVSMETFGSLLSVDENHLTVWIG